MAMFSERKSTMARAETRASNIAAGLQGQPVIGTAISQMMMHGGVYTLADSELMEKRMNPLVAGYVAEAMLSRDGSRAADVDAAADTLVRARTSAASMMRMAVKGAASVPTFYFYHLVDQPYRLSSDLVSYLVYPARHLRSPITAAGPVGSPPESMPPYGPPGKTYSQENKPSKIPAAFTFVGQFIDHDLTLNAVNLFDPQTAQVQDFASPLLDLDSVYGPRLDETNPEKWREVPMSKGYFCLDPIPGSDGYDVCRRDEPRGECKPTETNPVKRVARIGDKRNDENQIILQVHILMMRLHNAFRAKFDNFCVAKRQTIYHWQSFVANAYLTAVAEPKLVCEVRKRLLDSPGCDVGTDKHTLLFHRPTFDSRGRPVLSMPHEFAIGFRFGHSQLRSEYRFQAGGEIYRLFDSLTLGEEDLQGGKNLDAGRVIDWSHFADAGSEPFLTSSNVIDTKCNEVIYDLPESTIPDEIRLVNNLAKRNLIRSDSLGLCAGEDLAACYAEYYGSVVTPLTPEQVEPCKEHWPVFQRDCGNFRTPLWYYILREAEVLGTDGRLGPLGSLLVAEVILSGIYYAEYSFLRDPTWVPEFGSGCPDVTLCTTGDKQCVTLIDIAEYVNKTGVTPPSCDDCDNTFTCCNGDKPVDCGKSDDCWGGLA